MRRETRIAVEKYRLVNGAFAPLTAALEDALDQSRSSLADHLGSRCWVQNSIAFTTALSLLDDLLIAGIMPEELALTPEDEALRVVLPSDEDVLAYLEGFRFDAQVHQFTITVRNANELRALLDLTEEAMATERKANWDARATARSSDAGHHAARFRIMRQLNLDVRAAREQA